MSALSQDDIGNLMSGKDTTVSEQQDSNSEETSPEDVEAYDGQGDKPEEALEGSEGLEGPDGTRDLDFILDIPLEVSVELGRTKMLVNDLIRLGQGSIVELTKLADEPMDIYVNRKLFARGEVVVVSEKFGIRLTDIISPTERIKTLG